MKVFVNRDTARARLGLVSTSAVLVLASASPALAQQPAEQPPADFDTVETIVVTATKREASLQDIPVAVSVTSAQTIERAQIRDLQDLQTLVPSLKVGQRQSSAQTNFFIRGFGNGANNAGIEPSVGVFIDNVYRSRTASQIADLPDVARVEVLRGPQSTLFGKNASAGVISIVTREPQFDFGGNVEASYGNRDALVLKGVVTGPVAPDLAVSLSGAYNRRDGFYRDLGSGGRTNDRNRWFLRGQLLWQPGDSTKVRIIGDYGRIDENCCAAVNVQSAGPTQAIRALGGNVNLPADRFRNVVYNNFAATNKIDNYGLSAQIDQELGAFTLTSISAWRTTKAASNQDADFTSADILQRFAQDQNIRTLTQEFRLSGDITDKLTGLLGAYYFDERVRQHSQVQWGATARGYANLLVQGETQGALNIPLLEQTFGALEGNPAKYVGRFFVPGQGLDERYRLKNTAGSIFAQLDFEVMDRLTLTGGINYTYDKKRFSANVASDDVFAALNFNSAAYAPFRNQLLVQGGLAQQIGTALALGRDATAAEVQGFAVANPAAFGQIQTAVQAFANANQNNPLANPLNRLSALQYLPPFLNIPNAVENGRTSDDNISWTARAAFELSDAVKVYAGVATGFKASSINLSRDSRPPLSARSAIEAAGIGVVNQRYGSRLAGPEKSTSYEAGLKAQWRGAAANLAVFKQEIKGFQSNIFTGTGFFLANAGKQSVFGVEFEGNVQPVPPLTLGLAVTYLDPKYDSFPNSSVGDLTGVPPADIPEWSVTVSADYEHELANADRLILHADFHWEDKTQVIEGLPAFVVKNPVTGQVISFQPALDAAKPFTREIDQLNASLTYAMGSGLELSVWGRNVLNDRYIEQIFDSPAQIGSITGYPNQPRTYGVAARFRW